MYFTSGTRNQRLFHCSEIDSKSFVRTILITVAFVVATSGLVKITESVAQELPATDQEDAVILAERILIDESDDLVFDEQIQQNLIDEIERALKLVRIANPKLNEIRARRTLCLRNFDSRGNAGIVHRCFRIHSSRELSSNSGDGL